jgi:glycosyltransferase involved in cell wall biosynthesis
MGEIRMDRLRLLFWSETFYPTIGGTEMSLYRQIKELLRLGNEIIVISQDKNKEPFLTNEDKEGIFQRIELNDKNHHIFEAMEKIKSLNGIEILYITRIFKNDPLTHLRAIKELSHDIDTVLRVPTQGDIDALSQYPLSSFLDEMAVFICLNNAVQEEIKRYIQNPRIYSHRNGILVADFCKSKFGRDGPYLFIGRFTKTKGLRVLLNAWRKYKSSGGKKQLIVCGPFNPNPNFDELKDKKFLKCYDIKYIGAKRIFGSISKIFMPYFYHL